MTEEEALVRAFVVRAKRDRFVELLSSAKRRNDVTRTLAHTRDIDPRYIVRLPPSQQSPDDVARALRQRGAGATCHVISDNRDIDGQRMALDAALERVIGYGSGTLLSCVPGRLAYYEGEEAGDRCILDAGGSQSA